MKGSSHSREGSMKPSPNGFFLNSVRAKMVPEKTKGHGMVPKTWRKTFLSGETHKTLFKRFTSLKFRIF